MLIFERKSVSMVLGRMLEHKTYQEDIDSEFKRYNSKGHS